MKLSPDMERLVDALVRDVLAACVAELLGELRPRPAPVKKRKTRKKRRAVRSGGEAQLPRPKARRRAGKAAVDTSTGAVNPAVPGESPGPSSFEDAPEESRPERRLAPPPRRYSPEEIAANGHRVVVVRVNGNPPRLALLVSNPKPGFFGVRLSQGHGYRFSGSEHRICDTELVRDATDREAALGFVP